MKIASTDESSTVSNQEVQQKRLRKACEDFEAIMIDYLFKSMRQTSWKTDTEEFGSSRDLYEGMMDETLASQLSHQQGLGLAKLLYEQLVPGIEPSEVIISPNSQKGSSTNSPES